MIPPLFGCRTNTELCQVRGWEKNLPCRLLGALPKRPWIKRLRRLGLEVLLPLWRYAARWGLPGARRRYLLWPSGHAPHGMLRIVLYLTGRLPRAAHDGVDHF
jgi:hypothetical protein